MKFSDENILKELILGADGIYGYPFEVQDQLIEVDLRERVANIRYDNYLKEISLHHSIPVMDREVIKFLESIPLGGTIIDVGGCWGWHWRDIEIKRPDVKVFIVDFVRSNLMHAKTVLGEVVGKNIFLIHGDATNLIFKTGTFDGYWSVQTLQHIPNFELAVSEAHRVLKTGGHFVSYSLNNQLVVKLLYKIFHKQYHIQGNVPGCFYMARASSSQSEILESVFSNIVKNRYSEVIFKPEFKLTCSGREHSFLGLMDSLLSNNSGLFSSIARQHSFHIQKNS